jgi:hypothetical protein
VEDGVQRAARRGIELEPDICVYVDLVVVFGPGFEEDAAYPWARVLVEDSPASPGERVQIAMEAAVAYLDPPEGSAAAEAAGEERPS